MSTVKATNFQNAGSASVNIALDTGGNATVANTLAMGSSFLRNRIINGDMRIDQRNSGASVTPTSSIYTLDRWYATVSQSSKFSVQQSSTAPSGFTSSAIMTSLSAYSPTATDFFALVQFVEGYNASDLGWGAAGAQTVTLSFRVRSSLTGTFVASIRSGGDDAAYPATYTINSANTWETKTITIPGPTSGTYSTTNGRAFSVWFILGIGSSLQATANTWGSGGALGVAGAVNVVATNGATFYVTGVQIEVGTTATPFERRQFGQEFMLCQRYYTTINDVYFRAYNSAGGAGGQTISLPVKMRASPTLTKVGTWTVSNCGQPTVGTSSGDSTQSFYVTAAVTATGEFYYTTTATSQYITASAEI